MPGVPGEGWGAVRYASVCDGIGAAHAAWQPLGWECAWTSEIDPFPSAVVEQRWGFPNLGDMTRITDEQLREHGPVDLLVGGTPCQSFSVAGLRRGLADPRGNLALVYLGLVDRVRPRWVVWENVPGVLSSNGGRDFGAFLGALGELGYGFAYRVLDAQYCRVQSHPRAVPQRRRRVFVVGCLGDWRRAATVLLERQGMCGHPPPGREAGQGLAADVAPSLRSRGPGVARTDDSRGQDPVVGQPYPVGNCLTRRMHKGINTTVDEGQTPVIADQSVSRYHANHANATKTNTVEALRTLRHEAGEEAFSQWVIGVLAALWPAEVLQSGLYGQGVRREAISLCGLVHLSLSRQEAGCAGAVRALWEAGCTGCPPQGWGRNEQSAVQLAADLSRLPYSPAPAENFLHLVWEASEGLRVLREALSAIQEARGSACGQAKPALTLAVRRLTPEEAEALQGFPRSYTAITYRGKPAADGPRYKALGNSMAVNVMSWIGQRIGGTA